MVESTSTSQGGNSSCSRRGTSARMTITCADCGRTQVVPELPSGAIARCQRCDRVLARRTVTGFDAPLACAAAAFLLLPPAVFMPLMDSTIQNLVFEESRLVSSVSAIYREVWFPFAFGFLFFAFLFPAIRALLLVIVLGSLRWKRGLWQRGRIFRWTEELRVRSEEHTSELQSQSNLVCRLLLEKKKINCRQAQTC